METSMPMRAILLALCGALSTAALAADQDAALLHCRTLKAGEARLGCYDAIVVAPAARVEWSGRNGTDDFRFTARAGDQLVIEHSDAILVGALKDAAGNLRENLHMAGRGTLHVALRSDGDYMVTLSATGNWTARLQRAP